MSLISIRGATTVLNNSESEILTETRKLLEEIESRNYIDRNKVISIIFTCTKDLTKIYPAKAARELGYLNTSLMCFQEMYVEDSLEKCIRVNLLYISDREQKDSMHIYLREAKKLRPDLGGKSMNKSNISIAIDGPASAGKSTIAKKVADKLDMTYIDTGAMFRAVAYKIDKHNIDFNDDDIIRMLDGTSIKFINDKIYLDGINISKEIRENRISQMVSKVATNKHIRDAMLEQQREIASKRSVVMDGRDIGTVVLPDADLKIFLTAKASTRAKRRYNELLEKGEKDISLDQILREIEKRDKIDANREIAPLKASDDAHILDNSNLSIDESVKAIIDLLEVE